jgi:hypothetical protein
MQIIFLETQISGCYQDYLNAVPGTFYCTGISWLLLSNIVLFLFCFAIVTHLCDICFASKINKFNLWTLK